MSTDRTYCALGGEHRDDPCPCGWSSKTDKGILLVAAHAEIAGYRAQVSSACEGLEKAHAELAVARAALHLAAIERDALKAQMTKAEADNCEALVIAHGMGCASRNDEVRGLRAKLAEARKLLDGMLRVGRAEWWRMGWELRSPEAAPMRDAAAFLAGEVKS